MTFDERGLVALVITWHPFLWALAMCFAALLTWFATRMVRDVTFRFKPTLTVMMFIGGTCVLYGALAEFFAITSVGVDWISLSTTVN